MKDGSENFLCGDLIGLSYRDLREVFSRQSYHQTPVQEAFVFGNLGGQKAKQQEERQKRQAMSQIKSQRCRKCRCLDYSYNFPLGRYWHLICSLLGISNHHFRLIRFHEVILICFLSKEVLGSTLSMLVPILTQFWFSLF